MKEIKVKVIDQKGNVSSDPLNGGMLIESTYRVINIEKLIVATEKAIITMVEKIEGQNIEWLSNRVSALVKGEVVEDSFFIEDHFYVFSAAA